MALQKSLTITEVGPSFVAPNAYININSATVSKIDGVWQASAVVEVWYDQTASTNLDSKPIRRHTAEGVYPAEDTNTADLITWFYDELKLTPEYTGAIDV